jgi:hypothetical protein
MRHLCITAGLVAVLALSGCGGSSSARSLQPQPTKPGKYVYNETGELRVNTAQMKDGPLETVVYEKPVGRDQKVTSKGTLKSSEEVLRYQRDGVFIVSLRSFVAGGVLEYRPDPPVMFSPAVMTPGKTWAWSMKSVDGKATLTNESRAVRPEKVTVKGSRVDTWVIDSVIKLTGPATVNINVTSWASQERGIVVKGTETTTGNFGEIPLQGGQDRTLKSLDPA